MQNWRMVAKVVLCQFKNKLSKFVLLVDMLQEELSLDPKSFRKSYKKVAVVLYYLNPIQDVHFQGWSQMREGGRAKKPPLPKICHTCRTIMKFSIYTLPKEDWKNIWITCHTPWVLLTVFFHRKSANFPISRNTDIDCILLHNF